MHCAHPGVIKTNFGANMRTGAAVADPDEAARLFNRVALTTAEKAARVILRGMDKDRIRILIGADGRAAAAMPRPLGAGYVGLLARAGILGNSGSTRTVH